MDLLTRNIHVANDNAKNQKYEKLDGRIASTYAALTEATNKNSLYDSYIKAFRWSTDRLDKNGGIVCFVSNGAWLDGNSSDGIRKCLEKEFSSIYVFNLRGNQRTSGELSRKEGGKIFGSGSRAPIAITLLVKHPKRNEKAKIYYHDIGDYHSREEKLAIIKKFASVINSVMQWQTLSPNEHGDWINQRNDVYMSFIPLIDKEENSFFNITSNGVVTSRDAWVYNYSRNELKGNVSRMIDFYNQQIKLFQKEKSRNPSMITENFIDKDGSKISWSSSLIPNLEKGNFAVFEPDKITISLYRPFSKQKIYWGDKMIHRRAKFNFFFPDFTTKNFVIASCGGINNEKATIISDCIVDLHAYGDSQCFPLYYYEEREQVQGSLFDTGGNDKYIRRDGISDFILERARKQYGKTVSKEDIFYYVYGFLHSPEYRETFANDLKKMLPRLPLVDAPKDFWKFSKAGKALAELHINYESVPPYKGVKITGAEKKNFTVEKMRFPSKTQKDTIHYNSSITISNIPAEAYDYVVNGKSAIEWLMERYQISTHKESNIKNDPNDWAKEVGNPRYILDLLLSLINVSVQTVEIVKGLPKASFEEIKTSESKEASVVS